MKWSFKLGRFFGIDVYIHATFILLILFFGWLQWTATRDIAAALVGTFFILALFGCVLLHEYGHALTARKFGIQTRDITLLPIGGLARLERMPRQWWQELLVALAGPAVNVVIGVAIAIFMLATGTFPTFSDLIRIEAVFDLTWLMFINFMLVVFNLIPAFPMDGGRVLRALLAAVLPYPKATRIAATIGQGLALIFGLFALLQGLPLLAFIALFVWIGASQEAAIVEQTSGLTGIRVRQVMQTDFRSLPVHATLADAIQFIMAGSQHDFPVMDRDQVIGLLTRKQVILGLSEQGVQTPVTDAMLREFTTVSPDEMVSETMSRLSNKEFQTYPVLSDGQLIGLLTTENIGEFLMIQEALAGRR